MLMVFYVIASLIFGLLFFIDCLRYRKEINVYVKYGMIAGAILVVMETALAAMIPGFFQQTSISMVVGIDIVAFVRMTLFTCMGMYCCSILTLRDVPSLRVVFKEQRPWPKLHPGNMAAAILITVFSAVVYSTILFLLTKPRISEFLKEYSAQQMASLGIGDEPSLLLAIVFIEFAFIEEIVFRLGIQNYIARQFKLEGRNYGYAILAAATLWSLAHANILDPEWVKIAQVFPMGIALGFMFRKYGVECCILTHMLFNIVMMFLGSRLIVG